jgi:hypothetical protein
MGKARGKFLFKLHNDGRVGPNRTTRDAQKAMKFFNSSASRGWTDTMVARVTHLATGLEFEATTPEDLNEFILRVVNNVERKRPNQSKPLQRGTSNPG